MKLLYLLPCLSLLGACMSGPIFGDDEATPPPAQKKPVVETPIVETPIVETPIVETPIVETPIVEMPVVEEVQTPKPQVVNNKAPRIDYVPYVTKPYDHTTSQQIYTLLASRATNKMLIDTAALYANAKFPTLYVAAPKISDSVSMPEHPEYSVAVTKDIITGSHSYNLTDSQRKADYVLNINISRKPIISRGTTVMVYELILLGKNNKQVGSWIETLTPVINDDQSWW